MGTVCRGRARPVPPCPAVVLVLLCSFTVDYNSVSAWPVGMCIHQHLPSSLALVAMQALVGHEGPEKVEVSLEPCLRKHKGSQLRDRLWVFGPAYSQFISGVLL